MPNKLKYLSLFSGVGAFEKALDNLGIPYELVAYCEIDKYASKSYAAIHGVPETMNLGDITKVDEKSLPKDIDLITYGFPCQDISISGKKKGLFNEDGTKTRSGLFFDALRIIEETQPKVAIAENVKNLVGKGFKEQFRIVLEALEDAGYHNYWKVLNAKDFGVPQNRERVFIVSIRKDIDVGWPFVFPEGFPLTFRLKDVLEDMADEKFYLSDKAVSGLIAHKQRNAESGNGFGFQLKDEDDIAPTLRARYYKDGSECLIKAVDLTLYKNDQMNRVYSTEGISPSVMTKTGGGRETKILVREATKKGYAEAHEGDSVNFEQPNSKTRRGRVGKQIAQTLNTTCNLQGVVVKCTDDAVFGIDKTKNNPRVIDVANCITTREDRGVSNRKAEGTAVVEGLRIRKLTPKECFRLMGFDDSSFEKAASVNSNSQLYKQAGNSIVVPVLEHVFHALFANGALENKKEGELIDVC